MRSKVRGLAATYTTEDGDKVVEPFDIEIPDRLDDYREIMAEMDRLTASDDPEDHLAYETWTRSLVSADLYFVGLMSTQGSRPDPYRSAEKGDLVLEIWNDFLFNYARDIQFDSDDVLDTGARGHWKSTWKCLMLPIQIMVNDVDAAMAFFSFEKAAAQKHTDRIMGELTSNPFWTRTFPDAFGPSVDEGSVPKLEGAPRWSSEKGCTIPGRQITGQSPTFAPYTFLEKLPTGARVGYLFFDDIESDQIVRNPETVEKARDSLHSAMRLQGRAVRRFMNGTFHSPTGVLAHVAKLDTWTVRNYEIVDTSKPAPEIPAHDPLTGKLLPDSVRMADIEGEPRLLHPVEVAKIKAEHQQGGKLNEYYLHYFGDPTRGQTRKLQSGLLQYYAEDPRTLATKQQMNVVICLDPGGSIDPHYWWVWGVTWDRQYYWLDGEMQIQAPSDRRRTALAKVLQWQQFAPVVQLRVEIFGQSTIHIDLEDHLTDNGVWVNVQAVKDNRGAAPAFAQLSDGGKLSRAFDRWETPLSEGSIHFPRRMMRQIHNDRTDNLVERFVRNELEAFPFCKEDHGLDAGGLMFHADGKIDAVPLPRPPKTDARMVYHGLEQPTWRSA